MGRLEVEAPFFHFHEMGDELRQTPALGAQHLAEAVEQLLVREVLELPELAVGGHGCSVHPEIFGFEMAPGEAIRTLSAAEVEPVEIGDRSVAQAPQRGSYRQMGER
jgi:hypothetical protein